MTVRIEELLPSEPVAAQAVLHVRRKLRVTIREKRGVDRERALALLFGRPEEQADMFRVASESERPIVEAARLVADALGVAVLGHDETHVERCRHWLLREKNSDEAFEAMLAYDLGTLLTISRARDLAHAGVERERVPVPILIRGETGTGKELLAQAIHRLSGRPNGLHIIHVAGMPPEHVNDELFGHVAGAFTDAKKSRKGRIEEANGGTLLVDEIGDLSPEAQVRFLRVLQNGTFSRLGENEIQTSSVRVIAATWHDLQVDVTNGAFRQDLYHRVCVGEVVLPPLRERREESRRLFSDFLARMGNPQGLTRSAADALLTYGWPGNLRELEGVLRMAVASAAGGAVRVEDLPPKLQHHYLQQSIEVRSPGLLCDDPDGLEVTGEYLRDRMRLVEELIEADTPAQELSPELLSFLAGMDALPDIGGAHAEILIRIRENFDAQLEGSRIERIAQRLSNIAEMPDLPSEVAGVIEQSAKRVKREAGVKLKIAKQVQESIDVTRSPWMRIYTEFAALPVMKGVDLAKVLEFMAFVIQIMQSIAPDAVEQVHAVAQSGGLKALIAFAKAKLSESDSSVDDNYEDGYVDELTLPSGRYQTWTAEEWKVAAQACGTRKAMESALGIEGKTIKRYLDRHSVRAPWTRAVDR